MTITGEGSRSASRWWCCSQKAPNHHQLARDSRKRTRHRTTHKRRESAMKRTKTAATTTTARMEGTVVPSILELPPTDSCSHTSFNYKFYRYQYLRPVAILYIALAVILANVSAFEPDFVYPLENVTVAKGRDATFTCVVNNLGGYRVAWIKADAKAILAIHEHVITNNGRLSVTHNDYNTWTLVIRNVKMEDRGVYMCQVNTDPMKMQVTDRSVARLHRTTVSLSLPFFPSLLWQTAFLEVVIPPDIIYEETSGDMMVPEGGSAKLICKARGYPKPKIVWRREDGREIIARNGTHGKMKATIVEGEMLSLTKVTRSEMGAYMCIASNGVPPSVSKRLKLQVHFHPLIQVPNQLVGAPLGTDVTLICNVEASPKAINYWQRENGEMIISNERYLMNENESSMYAVQMTLVIRKLHKSDMGGYKCISKNSIGDAEGTIRLYEMELQKKTKSAHRVNSVEDTSGNDEINSTPNIDQSDESNKIHKNGRLYKGLQAGEHDLISSSTSDASVRVGPVTLWPLVVGALALALSHGNTPRVRC
ncbi:protein amalgam isoform X1 [Anopheles merus]|uniref:protein amalgam isoform X1 n=1 Tax=Anopheles merus TaxID=30066 RepID=UPI001BE4C191|nr:protein amalgam isoform X1 [Anopheles merus]XP_041775822.1 protein amalgam isoform X1 [Anopheles merus]XP_041775830.1 protein amalgam isoform X1 [Anopheles merus]XP_041775838.1 protein amalgam isoform X1 [Anopheles merus]XP_041775847.1 protein amalgam isoform X1 [Anopheles merus]XP_041775855.1 protein amalgam isoform X1 [Anopheles merus]XP_041775864.1 protein amalgam isoform X1 [Anopheles merus]XP_041775872.1 protein amalgam isoform X1 [Anopheles merus]